MSASTPIPVGNAPCSWGVLEFEETVALADPGRVLDEMATAGYAGTELGDWGFLPTEPERLQGELRARSLAMLGAFVPVAFADRAAHAEGRARALRVATLLAAVAERPLIVLADDNGRDPVRTRDAGRIRDDQGLDAVGLGTFAAGVEETARAVLEQTGVRTVFHHHAAGFVETPQEVERLMGLTDERLVGLCLDTGHFVYGGGDPVDAYRRYRSRVWHLHFKDCAAAVAERARQTALGYFEAVRAGVFCELGRGAVDFAALVGELQRAGYPGWIVVEQDVLPGMGTPLESAVHSRAYLRGLGLSSPGRSE